MRTTRSESSGNSAGTRRSCRLRIARKSSQSQAKLINAAASRPAGRWFPLMKRTVLIVEDDENDRFFESLVFKEIGWADHLRFVFDGQEAVDYLAGKGHFADRKIFP